MNVIKNVQNMIIYLDESKRLWKWEIVIWWFFSYHNTHYIDNFVKYKKLYFFDDVKFLDDYLLEKNFAK